MGFYFILCTIVFTYLLYISYNVLILWKRSLMQGEVCHKKGTHYLGFPFFDITSKSTFEYEVMFLTYMSPYKIDKQMDYNKMFGISLGLSLDHHKDSVRFVWRYNSITNKYDIGLRIYDYERPRNLTLVSVNAEEKVRCMIEKDHDCFYIRVTDSEDNYLFSRYFETFENMKYSNFLYPYFGGEQPAPKDVYYQLKRIQ